MATNVSSAMLGVLVVLLGFATPSALSQEKAAAPLSSPMPAADASFSIVGAVGSRIEPSEPVSAGQAFTFSAEVKTDRPAKTSEVQRSLLVLIDGIEALPVALPDSGPTAGGAQTSAVAEVHVVSMLLRAPDLSLPSRTIRKANVALVNSFDRRVLTSGGMVLVATSSWLDRLLESLNQTSSSLGILAALISAVVVGYTFLLNRRQSKRAHELQLELESARFKDRTTNWTDTAPPPFPAEDTQGLVVPDELKAELRKGQMLLFIGSHLGEVVGEPTFAETLRRLMPVSALDSTEKQLIGRSIERGDLVRAADLIAKKAPQDLLNQELHRIYYGSERRKDGVGGSPAQLPRIYQILSDLPFAGVLTTTWTDRLDQAFTSQQPEVISPGSKTTLEVIHSGRFFVLHMWGQLDGATSPLLGREQILAAQREGSFYSRFLQSLISGQSIVFIGASPSDIEWALSQAIGGVGQRYFAFVPSFMLSTQARLVAELLRERYGVQITPYVPTTGDANLVDALQQLRTEMGPRQAPIAQLDVRRHLTALSLTNIGPFKQLKVDFRPNWNIILGDNACGKSTILKAVALGLCGDTPQASESGVSLLRSGADEGRIELQVGQETFITTLFREPDGIRLTSSGLTPLQRGGWVVLGFPPMRGVWLKHSDRVSPSITDNRPKASDLLPLLSGGVDSRVNDLCQWIIGMNATDRGRQLLDSFFSVLRDLAPTEELRLSKIDPSGKVWVQTNDGVVPIEMVSQGMSSTIGWIGTLLQRLYEIYPSSEHPEAEPALILVDEIDAHLHPAWQKALVGLVQKHFKALQIIATTHSPLVVGGMDSGDVIVARRDPVDRTFITVTRGSDEVDLDGMRADQILTSPLFGMRSTRSDRDVAAVQRYAELLGLGLRTPDQESELVRLKERLERWSGAGSASAAASDTYPSASLGNVASASLTEDDVNTASAKVGAFLKKGGKR